MKKIRSIISICLVVLIMASMTSCDLLTNFTSHFKKPFVPKTAAELWGKIDNTMDAVDSYEGKSKMTVVAFFDGNEVRISSTGVLATIDSKDEYAYYTETERTLEVPSENISENMKSIEAFYDGKMFVANKDSSNEQKFVSNITAEKYRKLDEDVPTISDIDFTDCAKSDFKKNEDGSWDLNFSGYTKKTADAFLKFMEMEDEDFGATIEDINVAVSCTEKFYAKNLTFSLVFDQNAKVKPSLNVSLTYNNHNNAKIDTSKIKPEDYTLVPDVYILDTIRKNLDEYISAEKGAFTLNSETRVNVLGQDQTANGVYKVEYGLENGSFYYKAKVDELDGKMDIEYKGGSGTVTSGGESQTYPLSVEEAKAYVSSLLDVTNYDGIAVSSIKKIGDNGYSLTMSQNSDNPLKNQLASSTGIKVSSSNLEMIVTYTGDKLKKTETKIKIEGTLQNGIQSVPISVSATYVVNFDSILTSANQAA